MCIGDRNTPPAAKFVQASEGTNGADCGVTTSGSILCWGYTVGMGRPPTGTFAEVSAGGNSDTGDANYEFACALRLDGAIVCWGDGGLKSPRGRYTQVSTGKYGACGLKWNGQVTCWQQNGASWWRPQGRFLQISARWHLCGLRVDHTILCGGDRQKYPHGAPWWHGNYVAVAGAGPCAIDSAGGVRCWGFVRIPVVGSP